MLEENRVKKREKFVLKKQLQQALQKSGLRRNKVLRVNKQAVREMKYEE